MSYEKVAQFSMDFNTLRFKGRFASSNVFPISYESYTSNPIVCPDDLKSIWSNEDYFILSMLYNVVGGSFQLSQGVSEKYRLAFVFTEKTINESINNAVHDLEGKHSLWEIIGRCIHDKSEMKHYDLAIAKHAVATFKRYLDAPDFNLNAVMEFDLGYVVKLKPKSLQYTSYRSGAEKYTSLKELVLSLNRMNERFNYNFRPAIDGLHLIDDDMIFKNLSFDNPNEIGLFAQRIEASFSDAFKDNDLDDYYDSNYLESILSDLHSLESLKGIYWVKKAIVSPLNEFIVASYISALMGESHTENLVKYGLFKGLVPYFSKQNRSERDNISLQR